MDSQLSNARVGCPNMISAWFFTIIFVAVSKRTKIRPSLVFTLDRDSFWPHIFFGIVLFFRIILRISRDFQKNFMNSSRFFGTKISSVSFERTSRNTSMCGS